MSEHELKEDIQFYASLRGDYDYPKPDNATAEQVEKVWWEQKTEIDWEKEVDSKHDATVESIELGKHVMKGLMDEEYFQDENDENCPPIDEHL
jgi:hypothetical protein